MSIIISEYIGSDLYHVVLPFVLLWRGALIHGTITGKEKTVFTSIPRHARDNSSLSLIISSKVKSKH
jgi:hypothetical protein